MAINHTKADTIDIMGEKGTDRSRGEIVLHGKHGKHGHERDILPCFPCFPWRKTRPPAIVADREEETAHWQEYGG